MHDDTSQIGSSGCSVLTSSDTISNYNGNTRKDVSYNGGKWYLYRTQYSNYGNYDISNYNCINVESLNTNAVFEPIFYGLAFLLFACVIIFVVKTVKGFLYGF